MKWFFNSKSKTNSKADYNSTYGESIMGHAWSETILLQNLLKNSKEQPNREKIWYQLLIASDGGIIPIVHYATWAT